MSDRDIIHAFQYGGIRICPMRDGPCPHGFDCQFVGDGPYGYPCKEGWAERPTLKALAAKEVEGD